MYFYYVYSLKCSDKSYCTGITNNIDRRLLEHNKGIDRTCYAFKRRPVELCFQQMFNDILQAIYSEKKIKGWTRAKKEALIEGN